MPVMTGGIGHEEIRSFYAERFIPQMPQDSEIDLVSRTVRSNTVVDEFVFKCTHSRIMDFFQPVSLASALPSQFQMRANAHCFVVVKPDAINGCAEGRPHQYMVSHRSFCC
jgi:hypothetical protein